MYYDQSPVEILEHIKKNNLSKEELSELCDVATKQLKATNEHLQQVHSLLSSCLSVKDNSDLKTHDLNGGLYEVMLRVPIELSPLANAYQHSITAYNLIWGFWEATE